MFIDVFILGNLLWLWQVLWSLVTGSQQGKVAKGQTEGWTEKMENETRKRAWLSGQNET